MGGSEVGRFRGWEVQRFKVQRFRGSRVQRFKVQRFRGSGFKVQRFRVQGSEVQRFRVQGSEDRCGLQVARCGVRDKPGNWEGEKLRRLETLKLIIGIGQSASGMVHGKLKPKYRSFDYEL